MHFTYHNDTRAGRLTCAAVNTFHISYMLDKHNLTQADICVLTHSCGLAVSLLSSLHISTHKYLAPFFSNPEIYRRASHKQQYVFNIRHHISCPFKKVSRSVFHGKLGSGLFAFTFISLLRRSPSQHSLKSWQAIV